MQQQMESGPTILGMWKLEGVGSAWAFLVHQFGQKHVQRTVKNKSVVAPADGATRFPPVLADVCTRGCPRNPTKRLALVVRSQRCAL
eukprot:6478577-Amphidinium_carterae.1